MQLVHLVIVSVVYCQELRFNQSCTDIDLANQCEEQCLQILGQCLIDCELNVPGDNTCKMLCARDDADCIDACP